MAKIALVRPPTIMPAGSITTQQGVPSIGIAYLTGVLKEAGHTVSVVDAFGEAIDQFTRINDSNLLINGLTAAQIVERIPADVDIIAVSCMYSNEWLYSKVVIRRIQECFQNVPLIGGGEHFTADPEYSLMECPGMHSLVLGEGEETIVELVDAIETGKDISTVAGIAFLKDDKVVKTATRARIRGVDEITEPSWDEMPLEAYLDAGLGMSSVRGRNMPMIASRGCPYKCTFCSNPLMWTQRWIARDPQKVLDELKGYIKRYKVNHIEFYDLTAIVKRQWILEFASLLIRENLGITWALPSGTRSEAIDDEVVEAMKDSGCHSLTYAPEAGSPATLKRIKKMVNLTQMLMSMRSSVRCGLLIKANLIVGFPGQTKREVLESFVFMVKMAWVGVHDVAVFPFVPYPGSELFFQLVNEGLIRKDSAAYEAFLSGNVYNEVSGMLSWSENISHRLIKYLTVGGMGWFYFWQFLFRPHRFVASLWRLFKSKPVTMFDMALDGILRNFVTRKRKVKVEAKEEVPAKLSFKDVAKELGVSPSASSMAMNRAPSTSSSP
ncbi:MAG: radical SAM protein [Acidobacteria bacterium]|nr:radical SAM protein [Acidobacteriota bacterium]